MSLSYDDCLIPVIYYIEICSIIILFRSKGPDTGEEGGEEGGEGGKKSPEEEIVYTYIPPVSKPWVSLGSEKEIAEEAQSDTRSLVIMQLGSN